MNLVLCYNYIQCPIKFLFSMAVPTPSILHGVLSERSSPELTPLDSSPKFYASMFPSRSSKLVFSRRHIMPFSNSGSLFDDRSSVHSLSSTRGSLSGMEARSQTGTLILKSCWLIRTDNKWRYTA